MNSQSLDVPDLEQPGEHVESEHGAGAIRVGQHLVDVAAPGLLLVLAGCRLEGGDDGREERRWQGRRLHLQGAVWLLLLVAVNTDRRSHDTVSGEQAQWLRILSSKIHRSHERTTDKTS